MARRYVPRRASKRWLEGAPNYILDCFDSKNGGERYTILFTGDFLVTDGTFAGTWIQGLGMSDAPSHPQRVSIWFELKAYEAARYRYRCGHDRIKWLDLPENIRKHVIARAESD